MDLDFSSNPEVAAVFNGYSADVRKCLLNLRRLILETAESNTLTTRLEETLKWGEPSYLTKHGSTIRIDWKSKSPEQYAMYFKCTSRLVPTFKTMFGDTFQYEGDRAIVFRLEEKVLEKELKQCIAAALCYHKVKHLPTLGI